MYLLDTNICIYIIKKRPINVLNVLESKFRENIFISSITIAELEYGIAKSKFSEKNRISLIEFLSIFQILTFDDSDAVAFGAIKSRLENQGNIIGPMDLLIAAQVISKNLILVTNNTKEFKRIEEINIGNWVNN